MQYRDLLKNWVAGTPLQGPLEFECPVCKKRYHPRTGFIRVQLDKGLYDSFCSLGCKNQYAPLFVWEDLVREPNQLLPEWLALECFVCKKHFKRERFRVQNRLEEGHQKCFCGKGCASSYAREQDYLVGKVPCGKEPRIHEQLIEWTREECREHFDLSFSLERLLSYRHISSRDKAPSRGYEYQLLRQQAYQMILGNCVYCGATPNPLNGIDRVMNSVGYLLDNCVSCCARCNKMKMELDGPEFIAQAHLITLHQARFHI